MFWFQTVGTKPNVQISDVLNQIFKAEHPKSELSEIGRPKNLGFGVRWNPNVRISALYCILLGDQVLVKNLKTIIFK